MRLARQMRNLSAAEMTMAADVFGTSLPAWQRIIITDGLGPFPGYDDPYAVETGPFFMLNLGPDIYPDATKETEFPGYDETYKSIFIHEMTHIWQYYHGYWVILRSFWANTAGAGYKYKPGDAWDDYNVEQQADLVMDWFKAGMSKTDERFVYIEKIIRPGIRNSLMHSILIRLPVDKLRQVP